MEELHYRHKRLVQIYRRLEYSAQEYEILVKRNVECNLSEEDLDDPFVMCRDALVLRFQYSYFLTWKLLKVLLRYHFSVEAVSPKSVFQECSKQNILNVQEVEVLLGMTYFYHVIESHDEEITDEMGKKIIEYNDFLQKLEKKLALIIQESQYV